MDEIRKKVLMISVLVASLLVTANISFCDSTEMTRQLALDIATEGNHEAAAIEYRRLALMEEDAERRAGYYWAAAYEYLRMKEYELTAKMLDHAEDDSQKLTIPSLLIRAEATLGDDNPEEAGFYLQSIIGSHGDEDVKAFASRRLARIMVSQGDIPGAKESLLASSYDNSSGIAALERYKKGRDKSPRLGGILGLIPGLGYAYSGEYANALRSLILNGLFIYGMTDTARNEQWGAFTAITFFELTWYTGSIYGGIDAAHRYNRNRLNQCLTDIDGRSGFSPDLRQIPIIMLNFEF